jgi:outer membrane protein
MKQQLKLSGLLIICLLAFNQSVMAQDKIAHINSQEFIESMPAYKSAMKELQQIDKSYRKDVDEMLKEAEKTNKRYQAEQEQVSQQENQKRAKRLKEMQDNIMKFSDNAKKDLQKKREELLRPVYEKAREIIQKVAREKGFNYVLDSTTGTGLLLADGYDLMDDVKAELASDSSN